MPFFRADACGRQDHGLAVAQKDRAAGLLGKVAELGGQFPATDRRRVCLFYHVSYGAQVQNKDLKRRIHARFSSLSAPARLLL